MTGRRRRMIDLGQAASGEFCWVDLAAADAGARVTIAADACAGSTAENHAAALHVMGLYPPQITVSDTETVLAGR